MPDRPTLVDDLVAVGRAGVAAVDGECAVAEALAGPDLAQLVREARRVLAVAVGKAAPSMYAGLRRIVVPVDGIVVSHDSAAHVPDAVHYAGDHPLPGPGSAAAGRAVLSWLEASQPTAADLVIVCVSGGTSALMAVPVAGLETADLHSVSDVLLRSGVGIGGINAVRRLLSATHNGGLAAAARPAKVLGLLMDDTPEAPRETIGSGPTFPAVDSRTEARRLVEDHLTGTLRHRCLSAIGGAPLPRVGEVRNEVVLGPEHALAACAAAATALGYEFVALPALVSDVSAAAEHLATELRLRAASGGPVCIAASGEVAVRVGGAGRGGRCQQFAWEMIPLLRQLGDSAFVGLATDGRDHLEGVGGAWVSSDSAAAVDAAGLSWGDLRAAANSNAGLVVLGGLLPGGSTGGNVADLYLAAAAPQARSSR